MSEPSFLERIAADPKDRSIRLVYADWLEEAGDPRSELIRIEEEMRTIPIDSDRFWELKPRRNALRAQSDASFLTLMGYGTDYQPCLSGFGGDWRGRWRHIRELVERWYGIEMGDVGRNREAVAAAEIRLGIRLPAALQEWIAFVDELGIDHKSRLFDGGGTRVEHNQDYRLVSFLFEEHGYVHYVVKDSHLQQTDPPVDFYYRESLEGKIWDWKSQEGRSLTEFVLEHFLRNLDRHSNFGMCFMRARSDLLIPKLAAAFSDQTNINDIIYFESKNMIANLSHFAREESMMQLMWYERNREPSAEYAPLLNELRREAQDISRWINDRSLGWY